MVAFEKKKQVIPRLTRNLQSQSTELDSGSSSHLKAGLDRNDRHSQPNITTATGGGFLLCTKKNTPNRMS